MSPGEQYSDDNQPGEQTMFHVFLAQNGEKQHHPTFRNDDQVEGGFSRNTHEEEAPTRDISIRPEHDETETQIKKKRATPKRSQHRVKKPLARNLKIECDQNGDYTLTYCEINNTIFERLQDDRHKSMKSKFIKHQQHIETLTRNQSNQHSPVKSQELLDNFRMSAEYEKQIRDKRLTTFPEPLPDSNAAKTPKRKRTKYQSVEDKMKILSDKHLQKLQKLELLRRDQEHEELRRLDELRKATLLGQKQFETKMNQSDLK